MNPVSVHYSDEATPTSGGGKKKVGFGAAEDMSEYPVTGSGGGQLSWLSNAVSSLTSNKGGGMSTKFSNQHSYREPIPDTMFYRNDDLAIEAGKERPKLQDLLKGVPQIGNDAVSAAPSDKGEGSIRGDEEMEEAAPKSSGYNFGMWEGVFIRCLLNIWGVMMFLRLTWVVGQAGIGWGTVIIMYSVLVTTITTVSLSAICTNGEVQAGGAYFMISRSLGPEFGAAIGMTFYAANAISIAMYLIGFAEALAIVLGRSVVSEEWDLRVFALIALGALMGIAMLGGNWEIQAQKVLLVVMLGAIASYFVGTFENRVDEDEGLTGFSGSSFRDNWGPSYDSGESWMTVFGVFFPAVTGIMAGANISGDLADPQKAIPRGTLLAIALSTFVYALMAWLLGCTIDRETLKDYEDSIAVVTISGWGPVVYAGIFAATLSSALAQLIGAPRILMSVARDDIFPFLAPFKKGWGRNDEPMRGYALTLVIAIGSILVGSLNAVAPLITNFFLASYALVNYACFASSMVKAPSWRPTYTAYNPFVALVGAVLCFVTMVMVSWVAAAITVVICLLLYKYVDWAKPDVNWGSAGQAWRYLAAVQHLLKLEQTKSHVKTFRPQYLVLCGQPEGRDHLIQFVTQLSEGASAVIAGNVVLGDFADRLSAYHDARNTKFLVESKFKAFLDVVVAPTLLLGVEALLQLSGMSHLRPNTVVLGFKKKWQEAPAEALEEYVKVIQACFGMGMGVVVLRGVEQLLADHPAPGPEEAGAAAASSSRRRGSSRRGGPRGLRRRLGPRALAAAKGGGAGPEEKAGLAGAAGPPGDLEAPAVGAEEASARGVGVGTVLGAAAAAGEGTIDVWWLVDDGGLTILLPYLLSTHAEWKRCPMRLITVAKRGALSDEQTRMTRLLRKFRIRAELVVVDYGREDPLPETVARYEALSGAKAVRESGKKDGAQGDGNKSFYFMRLSELLREHSAGAALAVVSLPVPRVNLNPRRYMAYLELLSDGMPPCLLMRGNNESVLTFYS